MNIEDMEACEKCPNKIYVAASRLNVCTHCGDSLCTNCMVSHAKELKMTYITVPGLMH